MRPVRSSDEELGIDDLGFPVRDVGQVHRIHVMDDDARMDLTTWDPQVATLVSNDDEITDSLPLSGGVERLVDPAVESESGCAYSSVKREIAEPLLESLETSELTVGPSPRSHRQGSHLVHRSDQRKNASRRVRSGTSPRLV